MSASSGLVCFRTGDGAIKHLIDSFQPCNIFILVKTWDDFASSFNTIDWQELSQKYSNHPYKLIIAKIDNAEDALVHLTSQSSLFIHGCLKYVSNKDEYSSILNDLTVPRLTGLIKYLGYTIDEYNMIVNSTETLSKSPRIFSKPKNNIESRAVVCASGPSLDQEITQIRQLSLRNDTTIICGGSSYKTLVKNGINVDFLVLVERACGVYDDYYDVFKNFGMTSTKLVMSSTCHADLCDIFADTCVYYRPALTPLSLFSMDNSEF